MMMFAVPVIPVAMPVTFQAQASVLQNHQAKCVDQQQQWQMSWQLQLCQQQTADGFAGRSIAQAVVDTTLAASGVPIALDFTRMCQILQEIASALRKKDPEVVRSTFQRALAPDAVLTMCTSGKEIAGRDRITEQAVRSFQTIPDLEIISDDVVMESQRSVRISQRFIGTAAYADLSLPYFQVGKHACKTVSTVFTFDEEGRVKQRQETLVFAVVPSIEPSMVDFILPRTLELSATPAGSRLLQEAVEKMDLEDQVALAEHFHGRVIEASRSSSANFILQKLVERLPSQRVQFIASEMTGCAVASAQNRFHSRIIERIIEHCPSKYTESIIDELIGSGIALCTHAYGSFVVQSILVHGTEYQRSQLCQVILEDVHRLAKHKFGSTVVRTALVHGPSEQKHMLIEALTADSQVFSKLNQYQVVALCTDAYGNFVVQSILEHGTECQRSRLAQVILADVHRLATHKFCSNVVRTALVHSPAEQKHMLIDALTADARELAKLSHHKFGSFVARDVKVARKQMCN